jgi:small subunit ribosomal protein S19
MPKRVKKSAIDLRKKKEFTLRGHTIVDLKKMPTEDLMKLLPSRQRRSLKRGMNDEQKVFYEKATLHHGPEALRTHVRDAMILPSLVGMKIAVFSGKEFKEVEIKTEMIGHYLGEFVLTRRFEKHSGPGVGATRSSKFLPLK